MAERPIHLVIPMSGQGSRYRREGYAQPKPLIPVSGTPMIERLLANFPERWPATFVLSEEHRATDLPEVLRRLRPAARLLYVDHRRPSANGLIGPARATAAALSVLPPDVPVLVSYCDYGMVWDPAAFERFVAQTACDGCVVSYRGFHAHYLGPQMYAYSRLAGERVVEVREKACFTDDREQEYASAGAYYFGSATQLATALQQQAALDLQTNGEHYVSLTVQALLRENPAAHVRVFEIPGFFQWGTPADLRDFEYWERTFAAWHRQQRVPSRLGVAQRLVPMAGQGSRFQALSAAPKPFLRVVDQTMVQGALASLPPGRTTLVALAAHQSHVEAAFSGSAAPPQVVWLGATPPGQALSTQAGLADLVAGDEVLVSACDHEIVLDDERWRRFLARPDCDAAIFTIRGYPAARRRPEAFAYVVPQAGDAPFPLVERVSVKKPLSARPETDDLLVGTFWFKSAELLAKGIAALVKADDRVNGELYLDSIFTHLKTMGCRVRMIPLDGYLNRGDPDSLAESLYYQEMLTGRRPTPRPRY